MNRDALKQGIKTAIAEVIGFPDKDCVYEDLEAATESVVHFLEHQPCLLYLTELNCTGPGKIVPPAQPQVINAYFDGNGNKDMTGLAQYRVYWPDGIITPNSTAYEKKTNNELEYQGLINLLDLFDEVGRVENARKEQDIVIMGDSKLVIEQVSGRWRVKEKHLVPLCDKAINLLSQVRQLYKTVELRWCPSAENLVDAHA